MSFPEIGLTKVLIKLVWISFPDIGQAPWKIWIPKNRINFQEIGLPEKLKFWKIVG